MAENEKKRAALDIGFFDDGKVGKEARRLADCFNVSARMKLHEGNPLAHAEDLFTASTGLAAIPVFNDDEEKYLKWKLIETAAALNGANISSLYDLEEAAGVLHRTARQMKLIR